MIDRCARNEKQGTQLNFQVPSAKNSRLQSGIGPAFTEPNSRPGILGELDPWAELHHWHHFKLGT